MTTRGVLRPVVGLVISIAIASLVMPAALGVVEASSVHQYRLGSRAAASDVTRTQGGPSVTAVSDLDDPAPATPTGLRATPGDGTVSLSWDANIEPDLAGYDVYRAGGQDPLTVRAIAAGDIASCASSGDEATAALLDTLVGDVITLGDNVYDNGTTSEFNGCFDPTWGRAKSRTRPAPGNHEYQTPNATGYYAYFGAAAGDPTKGYYSYDYGTWHVIVLNSGDCAVVACAAGSAQEQWLRADLANDTAACTLAVWHHPRFSSGQHGSHVSMQPFYQALYDFDADLILNGHDHVYERFAPQTATGVADPIRGIREFVVGTGGNSHYVFGAIAPNSEVRNNDTYGVLSLGLKPAGYDWQFVPQAGKTFTDSGSGVCHDAAGPVTYWGSPLNGTTLLTSSAYTDTTAVNGTAYQYTVTAVDAGGHESGFSSPVAATPAASGPIVYADDPFGRTSVNTWGSAPTGGAYTLQGTVADYDVTAGAGTMSLGAGVTRQAALAAVSATDVDLTFRVTTNKVPTGGAQFIYGIVRRVSATSQYHVKLRLAPNGNVFVQASTLLNNTEAPIGSEVQVSGLTFTPGSFIRLRAQVSGTSPTTLRLRAWADGASEPGTWQYTATNNAAALQAAGGVGLRTYLSGGSTNAPVLFSFDDFRATGIGAPPVPHAPVFSTDIGDRTDAEGDTISGLDADAGDADGDTLTYSATGLPGGISINASSGAITGTLGFGASGSHDVTLTVTDGSLSDTDTFTWTVTDTDRAPSATVVLTPAGPATDATLTATATKSDPDGDAVSLTYVWKVNGATRRTFTSGSALTDTFDLSAAGNGDPGDTVRVEVTPSDGTLSGNTVADEEMVATPVPHAPVFSTDIGDRTDAEGDTISGLDADASDADGDTLTYSATGLPGGISINASSGAITGTLGFGASGSHDVTLTVTDGSLSDTDTFTWTVTDTDRAPSATVVLTPAGPATDATLTATATKSDPDGDAVSLTYVWKVNGATRRTFTSGSALTDTFDLSAAGNGDPGDTVRVEVTPSDGTLSGNTVADQVTVAASGPIVYADDPFGRTSVNTWGSAPTGGAYTLQGTVADYDVTAGAGTMSLGAGVTRQAALAAVSATDVDLTFRVTTNKVPTGGAQFIYGIVRRVSATSQYHVKLRLAPNGNVFVQASTLLNNTEAPIGSEVQVSGLTFTPGSFIRLRAQVSGTSPTTLRLRAWADGASEPGTWQYTATNNAAALQAAGGVGLRGYISGGSTNAPVLFSFDDFRATGIGGP